MAFRIFLCTPPDGDTPPEPQSPHVAFEAASGNATGVPENFVPRRKTGLQWQSPPQTRAGETGTILRFAHRMSSPARISKVQANASLG